MEWEQQKDDLLSALKNLEANFYYFNDQENDDIRTNLIKLESKKTDEDLSEIKKFFHGEINLFYYPYIYMHDTRNAFNAKYS